MKKVFIRTYGCQMNVYDSARMSDALAADGYAGTDHIEDADLVVLNTCHIREKAAEKVYSELGRIRRVREGRAANGLSTVVAVAGCVAQAEGEEMIARAPGVDLVIGPQAYHRLPALAERARGGAAPAVETDFPVEDKFGHLPEASAGRIAARGPTAFLTIQEGCDKFCTFCVVPYTRGAEFSRPVAAIVGEAKAMAEAGVREITLLGQNVNAYHGEGADGGTCGLGDLIRHVAEIDGLERIRYTTSHPRDVDDALIEAHRDVGELMPYLHLPVQAGADRVLAAMNRGHTADDYRRIVDRIRAARSDLALSGDFIVGFPGETDSEFEATMSLVREIDYASAYSFKYSPRPGTPAAEMENAVPEPVKTERLKALQALLASQQASFNKRAVDQTIPVLFDRPGRRTGQLAGRSPWLQSVHAEVPAGLLGQIAEITILAAGPNSLSGRLPDVGAAAMADRAMAT